jgi:hypothetical protein
MKAVAIKESTSGAWSKIFRRAKTDWKAQYRTQGLPYTTLSALISSSSL